MNSLASLRPCLLAALIGSVTVASTHAQVIIGSASGSAAALGPAPTPTGFYDSGKPAVAPLSSVASALAQPGPLWQRGSLSVRPHASYDVVYGTGILRLPGSDDEKVTLQTFSPGVLFAAGKHLTFDYTFTQKWYSTDKLENSGDHNAWIRGELANDDWRFSLSGAYGGNTSVLAETGGQTEDQTYTTAVTLSRQLGLKSEIEVDMSHTDRSAEPVAGTIAYPGSEYVLWSGTAWLRYHASQDLNFAAGFEVGYDEIEDAPDMEHYRPVFQFNWRPTKKFNISGTVGLERRRTLSNPARDQKNRLYSGSLSYSPFEATTFSVSAGRDAAPSYFGGQITIADRWSVSFQQRLLARLFLSASYSESKTAYDSTSGAATPNRDDSYDSFDVRLSTAIFRRGTVYVYYSQTRNVSSSALYRYNSDQIGGGLTYRF